MSIKKTLLMAVIMFLVPISACVRQATQVMSSSDLDTPLATPESVNRATPIVEDIPISTPTDTSLSIVETASTSVVDTSFVGLWFCTTPDGHFATYDFVDSGRIAFNIDEIADYEVLSESSILVETIRGQLILRVVDRQDNMLTLQVHFVYECVKQNENADLEDRLIGLWMYDNGQNRFIEFTKNGMVISSDGMGTYEVFSANSVYMTIEYPNEAVGSVILHFGESEDDTLTLISPYDTLRLIKIPGIPELAETVIGVWQYESSGVFELTRSGRFVMFNQNVVGDYEVVSNNTIVTRFHDDERVEVVAYNVIDVSSDQMTWVSFGDLSGTPLILLREK